MKYRSKQIVEAVQWDGQADTANAFIGESYGTDWLYVLGRGQGSIMIPGCDHDDIEVGDWIVKDWDDEPFSIWTDTSFKREFELAES